MPFPDPIPQLLFDAWTDGSVVFLGTAGASGPNLSPKGSVFVFDDDHLAYWERSKRQALANVEADQRVVIMYTNMKGPKGDPDPRLMRFYGIAELHTEGPIKEAIFARLNPREKEHPDAPGGIGVLVRVTRAIDMKGRVFIDAPA